MLTRYHTNIFVFLIFSNLIIIVSAYPYSRTCKDEEECIVINYCASAINLLETVRRDPNATETVKKLQKLTCGFEAKSPMVCCHYSHINESSDLLLRQYASVGLTAHKNFKLIPNLDSCGIVSLGNRVIGGSNAPLGSYPWLSRIGYFDSRSDSTSFGCAGTIINERYVLTAAHCFTGVGEALKPSIVRLAEYDTRSDPDCDGDVCSYHKDVDIDEITIHPEYNQRKQKQNDIALVRLAQQLNFSESVYIQPICLPLIREYGIEDTFPTSIKTGIISGFGKTRWSDFEGSDILQHAKVKIVPNDECSRIYSKNSELQITSSQICSGEENIDSCEGDSGSSLAVDYAYGTKTKIFQIGIVSFGPTVCGGKNSPPGVYTSVSSHLKFILDSIKD